MLVYCNNCGEPMPKDKYPEDYFPTQEVSEHYCRKCRMAEHTTTALNHLITKLANLQAHSNKLLAKENTATGRSFLRGYDCAMEAAQDLADIYRRNSKIPSAKLG